MFALLALGFIWSADFQTHFCEIRSQKAKVKWVLENCYDKTAISDIMTKT